MKKVEWKEFAERPDQYITEVIYLGKEELVCTKTGNVVIMTEEAFADLIEKTGERYDWVRGEVRKSR